MKGRGEGKEKGGRGERETDKARKYREMWGGREREGEERQGCGGGGIKAALYSLMWLLCAGSSQLLLQGLLHLHFSLKIAPVIIYLAGARHPTLCVQRIVYYFALYKSLSPVLCLVFGGFFHL